MNSESILKSGRTEKWLRIMLVIMGVIVLFGFVRLASAKGSPRIVGLGEFTQGEECTTDGITGHDFANKLSGDLVGCLYVFVESATCHPSGTYIETGTEIFVSQGDPGRFETTYVFTGKYEDCPNLVEQVFGRCQHPIVADSGTGIFEGVRGRLDFKDDVDAGNFPYTGTLNYK